MYPTPDPDAALAAIRHMVANPSPNIHPHARQMNWQMMKEARGQTVDLARLDPLARAVAQAKYIQPSDPKPETGDSVDHKSGPKSDASPAPSSAPSSQTTRATLFGIDPAKLSRRIATYARKTGVNYHGPALGPFDGDAA